MTSLQAFLWQTFSYFRILTGNIFLGVCICWSQKFWTVRLIIRKKGQFRKDFFEVLVLLFQNILMKSYVMGLSRVLGCSHFILKSNSTRYNYLTFLVVKLSPQKILWWILILVANCNICKDRLVQRRFPSGYCEKCHV